MFLSGVRWGGGDVAKATGLAVGITIGGVILVGILVSGDEGFLTETRLLGVPAGIFLLSVQQAVFLVAAWRYSMFKYRLGLRGLGFTPPAGSLPYLKAFGAWIVALIAIYLWGLLIEALGWDTLELGDSAGEVLDLGGGLFLSLLVVGAWGPMTEEVFFRGFALAGFTRRFGTVGAVVISAGLFALFHIDPALYVPIFIFGIVLGWLYVETRSIWPCIVAHGLQNVTALVIAAA